MNPDTLFERNPDLMVADMDGESVMMDVNQGSYFAINQVGSHIWAQLETPQTFAALNDSVLRSFQTTDAAQIHQDVNRFLTDLVANKLIREVSS